MNMSEEIQPSEDILEQESSDWDASDRRDWIANGIGCSVIIAIGDGSLVWAAIWLLATFFRAYCGMAAIVKIARKASDARRNFFLDVILGWSLYPGPLVGSFFGTLAPIIWNLPISSFEGGLIGLVVGPIIAAIEGIIVATIVCGIIWVFTRRWPE